MRKLITRGAVVVGAAALAVTVAPALASAAPANTATVTASVSPSEVATGGTITVSGSYINTGSSAFSGQIVVTRQNVDKTVVTPYKQHIHFANLGSGATGTYSATFTAQSGRGSAEFRSVIRDSSKGLDAAYAGPVSVNPVKKPPITVDYPRSVSYGNPITYTATVQGDALYGSPTGTVSFKAKAADGTKTTLGSATLTAGSNNTSTASVTYPHGSYPPDQDALTPGAYTIKVHYDPASSSPYSSRSTKPHQNVYRAGVTGSLSATPNTSNHGQTVTFHATVRPKTDDGLPPTGTVKFTFHGQTLCTATLSSPSPANATNNNASGDCPSPALPPGQDTIKAHYSGDGNYLARTATFGHQVNPKADLGVTVTGDANLNRGGNQSSRTGNGLVSYTVKVTNNGPDAAQDVVLSDLLPTTARGPRGRSVLAEFISDTGNCTGEPRPYTASHGQPVTCYLGTIKAGDSASVTFTFALFSRSRARSPYPFTFTDYAAAGSATNGNTGGDSATLTYYMR